MTSPVAALYSASCARCGVHALDDVSAQLRLLHTTAEGDENNDNNNKSAAMTLCVHSIALDAVALCALTPALHHEACRRRLRVVDFAYCALDNVALTCVVRLFAGGYPALREVVLTGNPFTYRAGKRLAWMCEGVTSLLSRPVTTPPTTRAHAEDAMCVCRDEGNSKRNDVDSRRVRSKSRRRHYRHGGDSDVNNDDDDDDDDDVYAWVGWDNNIVRVDLANTFMSTALQACVQRRIAAAIARREARKKRLQQQRQQHQRPATSTTTLLTSHNAHVAEAYVAAAPHDVVVQRCHAVPLRGCSDVHSNDDSSDHADHVTDGRDESSDDKSNDTNAAHHVTATRERVAAATPRRCVATVARAGGAVLMQDSYLCDSSHHDAHEPRTNGNDTSSCGGLPHYSAADTSIMPTQCVARDVSLSNSRTSPLSTLAPERLFDWDSLHKQRNYDYATDKNSRSSSSSGGGGGGDSRSEARAAARR